LDYFFFFLGLPFNLPAICKRIPIISSALHLDNKKYIIFSINLNTFECLLFIFINNAKISLSIFGFANNKDIAINFNALLNSKNFRYHLKRFFNLTKAFLKTFPFFKKKDLFLKGYKQTSKFFIKCFLTKKFNANNFRYNNLLNLNGFLWYFCIF